MPEGYYTTGNKGSSQEAIVFLVPSRKVKGYARIYICECATPQIAAFVAETLNAHTSTKDMPADPA